LSTNYARVPSSCKQEEQFGFCSYVPSVISMIYLLHLKKYQQEITSVILCMLPKKRQAINGLKFKTKFQEIVFYFSYTLIVIKMKHTWTLHHLMRYQNEPIFLYESNFLHLSYMFSFFATKPSWHSGFQQ
jgi:hypothetical protein